MGAAFIDKMSTVFSFCSLCSKKPPDGSTTEQQITAITGVNKLHDVKDSHNNVTYNIYSPIRKEHKTKLKEYEEKRLTKSSKFSDKHLNLIS